MKTCTIDGCDKTHRARGLCSTHYNQQHQPNRHTKINILCATCGAICQKDVANTRVARFCSFICRDLWSLERTNNDPMVKARAARKPRKPPIPTFESCSIYLRTCPICGIEKIHRHHASRYCTNQCRNKTRSNHKRKRHNIKRIDIFIRDNYMCWLCEQPCDPSLMVPHRQAPTIDHLLPQSLGGSHEPNNLATAHMSCNSKRGNSLTYPTTS